VISSFIHFSTFIEQITLLPLLHWSLIKIGIQYDINNKVTFNQPWIII
jgi:hypothetical protein